MPAAVVLAELVAEYRQRLERLNYAHTTINVYTAAARRLLRRFPDVAPEMFTPEHIERHLYGRGLAPRAIVAEIEHLRAFFAWLQRQKRLIRENPCAHVERPRVPHRRRPAPTLLEVERLLAVCRDDQECVLVSVLFFAGLRISEFRALTWGDVDLERRRLRVLGKGGWERVAVFPPRVAMLLASLPREGPWLLMEPCPRQWGRRKRGLRWVQETLNRVGRDAGLPYTLTAHLLRHGYFRLLKTSGISVEVAARLGGHRDIKTTVHIYGQLDDDDLQAAYDRATAHLTDWQPCGTLARRWRDGGRL